MSGKFEWRPIHLRGGEAPVDFNSTGLGPYALDTTQRHPYGRRGLTDDGRVFKYGHALGTCYAGYGAANSMNVTVARLINSVTPAAYVIGQKKITMTIAATEGYAGGGVVAQDELVGSMVVLGHGAAALTEQRMIVGNTAVASGGGTTTLTLDWPLALAYSAGVACECPGNPYRYLSGYAGSANEYSAWMCVPLVAVTTGYDFWGQTWGPCWCVPGGSDPVPGNSVNDRLVCFVGDGSVNGATALTMETGYQIAGFIIDTTASGTGAMPLVMLQIST